MAYLNKKMQSYKSKMVDPRKYPIDHIDLMAFLAREYQAIITNVSSLQQEQPDVDLDEAAEEFAKDAYPDKHNLVWMFKRGAEWQKTQMMKAAVEGVLCYGSKGAYIETDFLGTEDTEVYGMPGDKVRIIIVKKENK